MSQEIKLLAKVKSGDISYCTGCKSFHLVFNNLFFDLNLKELKRLKSYIDEVEVGYWEHKYACSSLRRKIPLATSQHNLVLMFNRQEITELRSLLSILDNDCQKKPLYLNVDDIDYNFVVN